MAKNMMAWLVYLAFVACVVVADGHAAVFDFSGQHGAGKAMVWLLYLGFLAYSVYCSLHENIFRTVRQILKFHWGRQISLDLYIGLGLFMALIYLHQGSLLVVALWLLPVLVFANLATLLYLAIHYESIVSRLLG